MMFKMNKMLEKRTSRLDKLLSSKNESATEYSYLVYETVDDAANALRFNKESVPKY